VGKTFNLGSGFEVSIGQLVEMIGDIMKVDLEIVSEESRVRPESSEVERLLSDNSKVKAAFGWQPRHGGLEGFRTGLEKTIAWFSKPENLARYNSDAYNT
jgi:dTDP-glucose 4,6-dehydratase/UDP-glucose 4-epimerase